MAQVKSGNTVQIHYTGSLQNGEVFDSSEGKEPLEFVVGGGRIIPGLEKAVEGMETGQTKEITIPAAEAYGPHDEKLVVDLRRDQLPGEFEFKSGEMLKLTQKDGNELIVRVTDVKDDAITVDANHPLAGEDLNFSFTLVSVA